VSGREHKAIAVQPAGLVRIMHQGMAIEHGADFRAPEGQTEVTGGAFMNGIDSKATSLSRCHRNGG